MFHMFSVTYVQVPGWSFFQKKGFHFQRVMTFFIVSPPTTQTCSTDKRNFNLEAHDGIFE